MKAVIKTQGRQFAVQVGDVLKVNRYKGIEPGNVFDIKEVLMFEDESGIHFGNPILENAIVRVKVLENKRDKKVLVLKHRRRGGFQRKQGHRQELSVIKVEAIEIK